MKLRHTSDQRGKFNPTVATDAAQAALMTLPPGGASDDEPSNEHPRSEHWLYVLAGKGRATVIPRGGRRRNVALRSGTLLVIERGERHQIRNVGSVVLRTLNLYVPPAYKPDGSVLKRARPSRRNAS